MAAGHCGIAFLRTGPVARRPLSGTVSARPERGADVFLGALHLREDVAYKNDPWIRWRAVGIGSRQAGKSRGIEFGARSAFSLDALPGAHICGCCNYQSEIPYAVDQLAEVVSISHVVGNAHCHFV